MKPLYIDTHAHVNFEKFQSDAESVIRKTLDQNIWMINVGSQIETSRRAIEFSHRYPSGVFAGCGLHPIHALNGSFHRDDFREMMNDPACVGIGETGLDYYRLPEDSEERKIAIEKQKKIFEQHIAFSQELQKPLIIHCRNAYDDVLEILRTENGKKSLAGVCHCFSGDFKIADALLNLGFYLSFTGIITFTKDESLLEMIRSIPLERIMIETDAPFLAPIPHRGKRNEPQYVRLVAEKIAEIKRIDVSEVASVTSENAISCFHLPK